MPVPASAPSMPIVSRGSIFRGCAAVLIAAFLVASPGARDARAAKTDERLVSITKTTIYGGLLGGLLGLAGALVVKESARVDSIRWGVALGAFAGFAYGITSKDEGSSDLSLLSEAARSRPARAGVGPVQGWRLGAGSPPAAPPAAPPRVRPTQSGIDLPPQQQR